MESVLTALAQMSLGGSGGAAGEEPRDDKPRLLCVEPAPPRQAPAPAEVSSLTHSDGGAGEEPRDDKPRLFCVEPVNLQ